LYNLTSLEGSPVSSKLLCMYRKLELQYQCCQSHTYMSKFTVFSHVLLTMYPAELQ